MTAPVVEDTSVDKEVDELLRCRCAQFPDNPCENELTSADELCDECRPRRGQCPWGNPSYACCGAVEYLTCRLIPLLGTDDMVHVRSIV